MGIINSRGGTFSSLRKRGGEEGKADVSITEEGGVERELKALVFLPHPKPLLREAFLQDAPPSPPNPPTQLRESRHPAGSSPAWVPERLARACTFPSKEDAAHFATPSTAPTGPARHFHVRGGRGGLGDFINLGVHRTLLGNLAASRCDAEASSPGLFPRR